MQRFFETLEQIGLFVSQIKMKNCCPHCSESHFLISHGFVYKKTITTLKKIIGKRIFCSNRFNKKGCGRTFQIYLSLYIPRLHYSADELNLFTKSLISGDSISLSYTNATGALEYRNSYRWLKKLYDHTDRYRNFITKKQCDFISWINFQAKIKNTSHFYSTLKQLHQIINENVPMYFQLTNQESFI